MDPVTALMIMLGNGSLSERFDAACDLAGWLARGGFPPKSETGRVWDFGRVDSYRQSLVDQIGHRMELQL